MESSDIMIGTWKCVNLDGYLCGRKYLDCVQQNKVALLLLLLIALDLSARPHEAQGPKYFKSDSQGNLCVGIL